MKTIETRSLKNRILQGLSVSVFGLGVLAASLAWGASPAFSQGVNTQWQGVREFEINQEKLNGLNHTIRDWDGSLATLPADKEVAEGFDRGNAHIPQGVTQEVHDGWMNQGDWEIQNNALDQRPRADFGDPNGFLDEAETETVQERAVDETEGGSDPDQVLNADESEQGVAETQEDATDPDQDEGGVADINEDRRELDEDQVLVREAIGRVIEQQAEQNPMMEDKTPDLSGTNSLVAGVSGGGCTLMSGTQGGTSQGAMVLWALMFLLAGWLPLKGRISRGI